MRKRLHISSKLSGAMLVLSILLVAFTSKDPKIETTLNGSKLISAKDFPELAKPKTMGDTLYNQTKEVAKYLSHKLNGVTEQVAKLSPKNKNQHCDSCELKPPQSCTPINSYFEDELIDFQTQGTPFLQSLTSPIDYKQVTEGIDLRCVRASLESFSTDRFRQCVPTKNSPQQLTVAKVDKPCVTERLASTLTKSFNIAAKCLKPVIGSTQGNYKYKLQKLFEMISLESGFHTNVIGLNNDLGIGQLQSGAVAGVNRIIIDEAQASLLSSNDSDCQQLYKEFLNTNEPIEPRGICNRIAPSKGNPWKNMIYTFLYFKVNRDILDDTVFNHSPYRERLNLPKRELEKLKDEMAKLAHNKGAGGATDIIGLNLMKNFSTHSPAQTAREVLAPIIKSKSNYLKNSATRAASVEALANLSQEESCIHGY